MIEYHKRPRRWIENGSRMISYQKACENPDYDMGCNMLIDPRMTDGAPRTSRALPKPAGIVRRYYEDSPSQPNVAAVASHNLSYRLARSHEVFSCAMPRAFNVFQDLPSTLKRLDVPEDLLNNTEVYA